MRRNSILGLAAIGMMSLGVAVRSEEVAGGEDYLPTPRVPTTKHQHRREIARRLRQQERAAAKAPKVPS